MVAAELERFAAGRYPNALAQGNRIPADYRAEVLTPLGWWGLPKALERAWSAGSMPPE